MAVMEGRALLWAGYLLKQFRISPGLGSSAVEPFLLGAFLVEAGWLCPGERLWSPGNSHVTKKMVYAASKDNIKRKLVGCTKELQANDSSENDVAEVTKLMR